MHQILNTFRNKKGDVLLTKSMDKQEQIECNISELIDKYLLRTTQKISRDCSTPGIRGAFEERTGKYIKKSKLNEILISKNRFKFLKVDQQLCYYNISQKEISLLRASKEILDKLNRRLNRPFKEYTKLRKFRNAIHYKYTFKYLIKLKCSDLYGKLLFSEKIIYEVVARELKVPSSIVNDCIELLNYEGSTDIPHDILEKLLLIFNITHDESITDKNYLLKQ
ncbi:hypothetical protein SAMN05216283_10556 [Sunxiuqinia elliptica]|uniref:Uncharacterized protein n=2 Tax=Sunxiuqinia elliptica TaxID=655355 RepID=A0A1I2I0P5_9BACT|nr:hypothetical protein SAMN05216283_10556 [Sunxiuqinia elliptica]